MSTIAIPSKSAGVNAEATAWKDGGFRPVTCLAGILILSCVIDLFFFTGFYSSDDISYYEFARYWWRYDTYPSAGGNLIGGLRLPIILWNRIAISLLGPNPQAVAATYILIHQALTIVTFALAVRLFDRRTALLAAYLSALSPPLIQMSTTILPDIPMAFFVALSLYAFFQAYDRRDGHAARPLFLWMLVCGVSVGGAYLIKESGLILLPFYFVMWLVFSRGRHVFTAIQIGFAFLLGMVLAFAIETAFFSTVFGKLFFRLAWTVEDLDPSVRSHVSAYGIDPLTRFEWAQRRMNEYYGYLPTFFKWFLVAILALYPFLKNARWPIAAMLLWQFGFLTWGTMRWSEYFPPSIQSRYYVAALPFAIIMVSFVACRMLALIDRVRIAKLRRLLLGLMAGILIASPLPGLSVANEMAGRAYRASTIGNAAAALSFALSQNDGPIVLSSYLRHRMKYVYQDMNAPWIMNANLIDEGQLTSMLSAGPFYYVEAARQPFAPRTLIDQLLNHLIVGQLVLPRPTPPPTSMPFDDPILGADEGDADGGGPDQVICWSADHGSLGTFRIGDLQADVQHVGWFNPLKTRTATLGLVVGHSIVSDSLVEKRIGTHSVRLVKVVPRRLVPAWRAVGTPAGHAHPESSSDIRADLRAVEYDLSSSLQNWGLSRRTASSRGIENEPELKPTTRLIGRADAGPNILLVLSKGEYEWLTLGGEWKPDRLPLRPNRRYEFTIETESEGTAAADVRLEVFSDPTVRQLLLQKTIALRPGAARFALQTGPAPAFFRTSFKLTGKGQFRINRFLIDSLEEPGRPD
ncbi:MAG: glycosyltransferase family 39 protein [Phycisphaerae bacterium]|nr:glycosyltransferase family 39 protein [Phycisphaerae bacterium]